MLSAASLPKQRRGFRAAGLAIPGPRSLRLGSASVKNVRRRPGAVNGPCAEMPHSPRKPSRQSDALDDVVQREEPLARQGEAVVGLQLAVRDEHGDLLLEREKLQDRQRVALAVDRAEVVAGERQVAARCEEEVVL